jgi:hypothetical protein
MSKTTPLNLNSSSPVNTEGDNAGSGDYISSQAANLAGLLLNKESHIDQLMKQLARLSGSNNQLKAQVREALSQSRMLGDSVLQKDRRINERDQALTQAQIKISYYEHELSKTRAENSQTRIAIEKLGETIADLVRIMQKHFTEEKSELPSELTTLRSNMHDAQTEIEGLRNHLVILKRSTLWKASAPLRIIGEAVKYGYPGFKSVARKILIRLKERLKNHPRLFKIVKTTLLRVPGVKNAVHGVGGGDARSQGANAHAADDFDGLLGEASQRIYQQLIRERDNL